MIKHYCISLIKFRQLNFNPAMKKQKKILNAIKENPDLPQAFVRATLAAKKEIEAGKGKKYKFGITK